ncbi:FG-GAP-like repeat-containing protein [Streptomyces sp. NPDC002659]|uniref:FG-GAP-like repeat-containing protein n=1 Tax=Streptomyces sp. NPDC002659 TaxID=3364656 RepID=UPI003688CFD1
MLSVLIPAGAARAADGTDASTAAAADGTPASRAAAAVDCAALPLAPFGDPGSAVGKATVPPQGSSCFTFTAEQPGMHRVLLQGGDTYTEVFDGESRLECYDPTWGAGWCQLPRAGDFTLTVVNRAWVDAAEASVAVVPLATTANCASETGTSWEREPLTATSPSHFAILCQPFAGKAGERITVAFRTTRAGSATSWITDATGAHICPHFNEDDSEGCVLPGNGPYRVLGHVSEAEGGFPAEYTLKIRRLSDPEGCAVAPLSAYNSGPTKVTPATGCKTFIAPATGRYDVYGVWASSGQRDKLKVYDRDGKTVCKPWLNCDLVVGGTYTVLTENPTLILDRASTDGCEPAALGVHDGTFAVPGEIDCLSLPLPQGARMAILQALNGPEPRPDTTVVDATGTQICVHDSLSKGTCELTGQAPYRVLVSTDDTGTPTGPYRIALHRTDVASNCPAVPAGDFTATSASARFTTGGGVFSHCLSIQAADHTESENLQLQAAPGTTSTAQFSVLDADGKQVCSVWSSLSTWTTCRLAPGVAHMVLVTGRDTPAEYTLTRRDVTATAKGCATNPATAVGGPSTGGAPGAPGTLVCRQVTTADARDTLHLNVRDPLGTANILAYGAGGEAVCSYRNKACAVTGSARYQVLVTVPTNLKSADTYRFDALRIATAAGPADDCAKVPNISYGYGPITGTLSEQNTAVCAALPTAYSDRFDFKVSDTAGGTETAVPTLYDASLDNNCTLSIPSGWQCYVSEPYTTEVTPSILVVGLPEKPSQPAYRAELTCTHWLCGTEKITVGSVTPTSGVSGTKATVTVSGTALHENDKVRIYQSGAKVESTSTSVSADRKTLTAVLDLTGIAAGTWNLSVITHNSVEYPRATFTVAPAALKNTAAPTINGTAQVGVRLTAAPGAWTPAPDSYAYQWKADGQAISGATAATYQVPASLRGKNLTVAVTVRKNGWQSATAESTVRTVSAARRDHAGVDAQPDGVGDLLSLSSSGAFAFRHGNGTGGFTGATTGSGWAATAVAVPFGDMNGDRCNDVLVRLSTGELRAYKPGCGKALTPTTPYTSLGTAWNQFNVLTSPGDLTGDGRADLVARQASTGDMYLYADDGSGKLKARGRIGTNGKAYRAVFGAGDLNGDGVGDLLAVDGSNSLWRYDGTAAGTLKPRVLVFGNNWAAGRNALVGVGDLNKDGKADLVSRNAAGDLLRNSGNGAGSFGATAKIGTGWQGYKALF